jgi:hypothetical protein
MKFLKSKKGGLVDLFIFMIIAFAVILISGVMIYIGLETEDQLQDTLGQMGDLHDTVDNNASEVITNTMGVTNATFDALHWIAVFLIFGMILGIFIGSYLVTTKPIFFIPYVFIVIIAIIVSVPMSNTYEILTNDATMGATYTAFTGASFIMLNLPIFISIIGIVGGIIMFTRMGRKEEINYGY